MDLEANFGSPLSIWINTQHRKMTKFPMDAWHPTSRMAFGGCHRSPSTCIDKGLGCLGNERFKLSRWPGGTRNIESTSSMGPRASQCENFSSKVKVVNWCTHIANFDVSGTQGEVTWMQKCATQNFIFKTKKHHIVPSFFSQAIIQCEMLQLFSVLGQLKVSWVSNHPPPKGQSGQVTPHLMYWELKSRFWT